MSGTKTILSWVNERLELLNESIKDYKANEKMHYYIEGKIMELSYLRDLIIHSEVM